MANVGFLNCKQTLRFKIQPPKNQHKCPGTYSQIAKENAPLDWIAHIKGKWQGLQEMRQGKTHHILPTLEWHTASLNAKILTHSHFL